MKLPEAAGERADAAPQPSTPMVESYRSRLEDAGRLNTPEGALVMQLVGMFADGGHSASGAAALSRELRAAMEVAMKDAATQTDSLDDLERRRQAKAAGS